MDIKHLSLYDFDDDFTSISLLLFQLFNLYVGLFHFSIKYVQTPKSIVLTFCIVMFPIVILDHENVYSNLKI